MNIDEMVERSVNHFLDSYDEGRGSNFIIACYAREELKLPEFEIGRYVEETIYGGGEENKSPIEFKRFYTWYYINYCVVEREDENKEIIKLIN
ncbi:MULTISPECIES: type 2 periplasmic-binding domain-containing protein [Niastella]|uniref:Uncharacterized protein n=1 Tax=Niastella soli TaxID=2821487 RepID=A0ABS3YW81_9BACT|nr:hypothetical protein [Niastella soli]MBO9202089.1 hypothetical protein [Niastella soli]